MKYALFILILFSALSSYSQCPSNDVTLTTQAELENFFVTYPSCTNPFRDFILDGAGITDLTPLGNLTSVPDGTLRIANTSITSLDGLPDNFTVGIDLIIGGNHNLTDMSGFPTGLEVGQDLNLGQNNGLINLKGMQDFTTQSFNISAHPNLWSLEGLPSITYSLGYVSFWIVGNPSLTYCNIPEICDIVNNVTFSDNAPPCNSTDVVQQRCNGSYPVIQSSTANSCTLIRDVDISSAQGNNNIWYPIMDDDGDIMCTINANGNDLGMTTFDLYRHTGDIRRDANDIPFMDRNYTITPTNQPSSAVDIRFYFTNDELNRLSGADGVSYLGQIGTSKFESNCQGSISGEGVYIPQSNASSISYTDYDQNIYAYGAYIEISTNDFSNFFLNGQNQVLPVVWECNPELKCVDHDIEVSWFVKSEINSSHYEILHSMDAKHFSKVGELSADQSLRYVFVHNDPSDGINYYKIRAVDLDRSYLESTIAYIDHEKQGISLYPNPVQDKLIIKEIKSSTPYYIYNPQGDIVLSGSYRASIDVSHLPSGIYTLLINKISHRFIKD